MKTKFLKVWSIISIDLPNARFNLSLVSLVGDGGPNIRRDLLFFFHSLLQVNDEIITRLVVTSSSYRLVFLYVLSVPFLNDSYFILHANCT